MGSWRERVKDSGAYELIAYRGYDSRGKKLSPKTKTIKVEGVSEKRLKKYLDAQAEIFQQEVDNGIFLNGNRITFEEFAERWMTDYAEKHLQPKTIHGYKYFLKRINQAIGHIKLDKLQAHHLNEFYANLAEKGVRLDGRYILKQKFRAQLESVKKSVSEKAQISVDTLSNLLRGNITNLNTADKLALALNTTVDKIFDPFGEHTGLTPETIIKYHKTIHTILKRAVKWQVVMANAADRADPPKSTTPEANYYDEEQVSRLLEAIQNEPMKYQAAVYLGVFGGLRVGEATGLEWSDIDFNESTIYIQRTRQHLPGMKSFDKSPKTERSRRTIKMPEIAMSILRVYKKEQAETRVKLGNLWVDSGKVLTQWNGEPMHPTTPTQWLNRWLKKNDFPHLSFHQLRHTHVSLLISNNVDIATVSKRVGHSKISTTLDVYSHAIKDRDTIAADKLDALVMTKSKKNPVEDM